MASPTLLYRADAIVGGAVGRAQLVGNGVSLATLVPIETVPGGFGTSPFGLSFGTGGIQPNGPGDAAIIAAVGQATLQTI